MSDSFVLSVDINCTEHGLHVGVMPVLQNIKRNALLEKKNKICFSFSLSLSYCFFHRVCFEGSDSTECDSIKTQGQDKRCQLIGTLFKSHAPIGCLLQNLTQTQPLVKTKAFAGKTSLAMSFPCPLSIFPWNNMNCYGDQIMQINQSNASEQSFDNGGSWQRDHLFRVRWTQIRHHIDKRVLALNLRWIPVSPKPRVPSHPFVLILDTPLFFQHSE